MDIKILPLYVAGNTDWTREAACAKPGAPGMFPNGLDDVGINAAKDTCALCPVSDYCLREALERGEQHGVWGGLMADERTQIRRNRTRRDNKAAKRARLVPDLKSDAASALDLASERLDGAA